MSGLCTSGSADATVKGNTTAKQDDAAGAKGTAAQYVRDANTNPLATEPDLSDQLIEDARKRMALQLQTKSSRRDALANNPGATPAAYSLLGG